MSDQIDSRLKQLEAENDRLQRETRRLKRAVDELSILNEVAAAIASTSSLESIVDLLVAKCVKYLGVEQGATQLFEPSKEAPTKTVVRQFQSGYAGVAHRLDEQITGWMQSHAEPLLINDLRNDARFRFPHHGESSIRNLLCVPLRLHGRLLGMLSVFNKRHGETFTDADLRLLLIIASQSAQVIENARLYEEEAALNRMERELETARDIQLGLLPSQPPQIPGYEVAARSEPANLVGGDYFDYLPLSEERMGLCVGDVSGKGLPASLLMANLQATIRGQKQAQHAVAARVGDFNELLFQSLSSEKFVTLFYGLLDVARHELHYCSAGHNPALLFSAATDPRRLEVGGLVLGVLPTFTYEQEAVALSAGDLVLVYSDGINEAVNPQGEEFGEERLCRLIQKHRQEPAQKVVEHIFRAVEQFSASARQMDDMTVMVIRRTQ
jgi:sigma-B regulation protein RsbU (phosphoserine phosphatase)